MPHCYTTRFPMDRHQWHDDVDHDESDTESTISALSDDEDTCKQHLSPDWPAYRSLLLSRGYRLDSAQCVIEYYESYWANHPALPKKGCAEYQRAFTLHPEALCRDPGLPDNLFRGKRTPDGRRIMVKAVGLCSREVDITRRLSTPPLRDDPRNHCIPVVDIISVPSDNIALIVMEEWSSELIPDTPCCLSLFLRALRSCISHMVFMHEYHIAHLDISLRNLVTDYDGHYACIDYELSRCFLGVENPRIHTLRATEIPPELERGEPTDPFKADIWAMGVLMLRAGNLTNKLFPELLDIIKLLLHQDPRCRPSASTVLQAFDQMVTEIHPSRLKCELQLNTFDLSDCAYCSKSCFARP